MKTITLWQPYARLIMDGRKKVETRSRPWWHVGPLAIHASLTIDYEDCQEFGYDPAKLICGAVLGLVDMRGCYQFPHKLCPPDRFGDYADGRYGYLLANVRQFAEPIPARGYQGIWNWEMPDGVVFKKK